MSKSLTYKEPPDGCIYQIKTLREWQQWRELKETIIEMRDSGGTGTQQDVCNFFANYMDVLEKNVSGLEKPTGSELIAKDDAINMIKELAEYHTGDSFNADRVIENIKQLPLVKPQEQEPCEDCISRVDALRVAKNEYLRGWHNALCKALSEKHSIHCEEGNFSVIQEETITGLGLSMDCAVGKDVESYMGTIPRVTPQEPNTWSLDDAREDFMYDVYKTLESLPTNDEANRIIDSFDRVTSGIRCDDAISRQQAIDKMQELEDEDIEDYGCAIPEGFDGERAIEALNALPSIQSKSKMGRWMHDKCDKCGASRPPLFDNYCPNCGVKMEVEK